MFAIPYWLAGPGWFREDHPSLVNVLSDGPLGAAGDVVGRNRPVTAATYALVFGELGDHPAAAFGVVVVLLAAVGVLLVLVLEPFLGRGPSVAVALLYIASPSQTSISHWASTTNVLLALALLLASMLVILRSDRWLLSGILVSVAVLSYEAILPAALTAWAVLFLWGRAALRAPLLAVLPVLPAAAWVSLTSTNDEPYLLRVRDGLGSLFGWGLTDLDPLWRLLMLGILVAIGVQLGRWITGRVTDEASPERLLLAGVATIVIGWSPFYVFGFGMDFTGQGDRANFLAAAGAAMCFAAMGWRVVRAVPERWAAPTLVVLGLLVALIYVPTRLANDRDWAAVWDSSRRTLTKAERSASDVDVVRMEDCPIEIDGVQGMDTSYAATMALRWWTEDLHVIAQCGDDTVELSSPRRPPAEGP